VIIQPAGRPGMSADSRAVTIAYQGQTDVPLLEFDIDYTQPVIQGDLSFNGLNTRVYKRTSTGLSPINASSLVMSVALWANDSLLTVAAPPSTQTLSVSLPQALTIRQGDQLHVQIKGDICLTAECVNYVFALEDSLAVALEDPQLLASINPLLLGGEYPLLGAELSVTGASLGESFSNYPNPFIATGGEGTTIVFVLPEPARVDIAVFTVTGDLVINLVSNDYRDMGEHQTDRWFGLNGSGRAVVPGTYFCRLTARYESGREETVQRKVAVLR
jgi:hypothetical protein